MAAPILSVIVPDCDTPEQTKITLRLLRKYSDPEKIRVFVIGTEKNSPSFSYAGKLKWIETADFSSFDPEDTAGIRTCWNDLFTRIETPLVLVMTSGVACLRRDWIDYLAGHFDTDHFFAFKCCSLSVLPPFRKSFLIRTGRFFKQLFHKKDSALRETCSCLVCRREYLGCCLDLSLSSPYFSEIIFQKNVGSLPCRETAKFFSRVADPSGDCRLSAFYRDILDAGELDL